MQYLYGHMALNYGAVCGDFEVTHPRCVEPKLLNGKSAVKTQLYFY